jgi:hypothetical protein
MRFMLVIYGNQQGWDGLTKEAVDVLVAAHRSVQEELGRTGELIDTQELAVEDARVVRSSDGTPRITDGPFTEGRQFLGGYYLIECAGWERATEIAGRLGEAEFAPIEVRRLGANSAWNDAS